MAVPPLNQVQFQHVVPPANAQVFWVNLNDTAAVTGVLLPSSSLLQPIAANAIANKKTIFFIG